MIKSANIDNNGTAVVVRRDGGLYRLRLLLPDSGYPEFTATRDHDMTAVVRDLTYLSQFNYDTELSIFRLFPGKNSPQLPNSRFSSRVCRPNYKPALPGIL